MEEIYSNGKISFFDRISRKKFSEEKFLSQRKTSLTPIPSRYSREPKKVKKVDIFVSPDAFYLSKKPIAFTRESREKLREKSQSVALTNSFTHASKSKKAHHVKSKSQQVPSVFTKTKLPSNFTSLHREPSLVPMQEIKEVSPRTFQGQVTVAKEKQRDALVSLAQVCEESLKIPSPLIGKQQKVAEKYSKEMGWITDVLESYGKYKPKIMKELYDYSSNSRNDLEAEREKIVNLMKTGAYDPNRNVVRLRARLKKRKNF
jgi:hypothetical protein